MGTRTYTLRELSALTGIEPRTIRSYVAKGLLQGPLTRGRSASYSESHLDRLREIQALKRQGMPLEEIRRTLLHARRHSESPPREFSAFLASSVPSEEELRSPYEEYSSAELEDAPLLRLLRILQAAVSTRAAHRRSRTELWTQVEVTPEIQLHVRGELRERERELVREIADHLRDILLGEHDIPL